MIIPVNKYETAVSYSNLCSIASTACDMHVEENLNLYEYAKEFALIYNSANTLFQESERCDADEKVFIKQLEEDNNFIYMSGNEICGFMSFRKSEGYYELTSLYVKRECQGMNIGRQLLMHFEEQTEDDSYIIVKVLNNAFWAFEFYKKNGYELPSDEMRSLMRSWNMAEKGREKILYKRRKVN